MIERRIQANGIWLHVAEEGAGFPVMLLHGFPDSSRLWREQVPDLAAAGFRVIAPDLRGYGRSDKPQHASAYKIATVIQDLESLLDALGIERAHVVGHDWGAVAAWAFAGHKPNRTARLVALSVGHPRSFFRALPQQAVRSLYVLVFQIPGVPEAALKANDFALIRASVPRREADRYVEELSRPGALTAALNWYRANIRPWQLASATSYPDIHVPAMGVWSLKDWALGQQQMAGSEAYCRAGWRYEQLDAGHWFPLTHAQTLNRLLLDFFSQTRTV